MTKYNCEQPNHESRTAGVEPTTFRLQVHCTTVAHSLRTDKERLVPVVRRRSKSDLPHVNVELRIERVIRSKQQRVVASEDERTVQCHQVQATRLATSDNIHTR